MAWEGFQAAVCRYEFVEADLQAAPSLFMLSFGDVAVGCCQ